MTRRRYISDIEYVDDGAGGMIYQPVAANYGTVVVHNISFNPDGTLKNDHCLCIVESDNHARVRAARGITTVPEFPDDAKVSAMGNSARNKMGNDLQARGIDTRIVSQADAFRDVVREIGKLNNPNFDENAGSWKI